MHLADSTGVLSAYGIQNIAFGKMLWGGLSHMQLEGPQMTQKVTQRKSSSLDVALISH